MGPTANAERKVAWITAMRITPPEFTNCIISCNIARGKCGKEVKWIVLFVHWSTARVEGAV